MTDEKTAAQNYAREGQSCRALLTATESLDLAFRDGAKWQREQYPSESHLRALVQSVVLLEKTGISGIGLVLSALRSWPEGIKKAFVR